MSVIYASGLKDTRMTAVVTAIDAGSGAGKLEIGTAAMALVLVTIPLDDTPAGTVSSGVLTLAGFPKTAAASAGAPSTAAAARIRTSADADVVTGLTVGVGTGDVQLDSTWITSGQNVTINSATITHG